MQDFNTVDLSGNLWFVRGEGVLVSFVELDDTGGYVDPSTHPRYLNIPELSIYRLMENDESSWTLILTPEEIAPIPRVGSVIFSIIDNQGLVPQSLWAGVIRERNLYE